MSHVLNYDGHYFRVDVVEVVNADDPDNPSFVGWSSDAFRDLKDLPSQTAVRLIVETPLPTRHETLRQAYEAIKSHWNSQHAKRPRKPGKSLSLLYTVWLFRGDGSTEFDFAEFGDATAFAKAAEKSLSVGKVGITNNESPEYLTLWERAKRSGSGK